MEKQILLDQARELISEAETGNALDLVEEFLKKDERFKVLYREAVQISAQFNKTKRDEEKSVISFENAKLSYNQVSDSLLNLLEYIENDDLKPEALLPTATGWQSVYQSHKLLFLLGLPSLVLSIAVLILIFKNPFQSNVNGTASSQDVVAQAEQCSITFPDTTLNILLLPFFRPGGDPIQVEGLILERLEDVSDRLGLKTDVELCLTYKPVALLNYPDADTIGRHNKAGMIIWGRAEKGKDFNVIKTRYKYLGESDTLEFTRLKWQGEKQITSDQVLSIITSQGELTEDIEATVMMALGLFADQTGNKDAALMAFENASVTDSSAILMKNMMLADAYIGRNEPEKALASLDTLLETHPNYWLGLNNRAMLRIESGDNLGAIEDLSVALEKRPTDPDMLLARGTAFEKSDQLYPAKADFEKFTKTNPERAGEVKEKLQNADLKIKRLEAVVKQTQSKPVKNQTRNDLITAADASRQLGDSKQTDRFVTKGLELSPNNPKLIAIQIENLLKDKKTTEARLVLKNALSRGVKKEDIVKNSKIVKSFVEQPVLLLKK